MNVMELAQEADFEIEAYSKDGQRELIVYHESLEKFAALVRAESLHEAANLCLKTGIKHPEQTGQEACASAIRNMICRPLTMTQEEILDAFRGGDLNASA